MFKSIYSVVEITVHTSSDIDIPSRLDRLYFLNNNKKNNNDQNTIFQSAWSRDRKCQQNRGPNLKQSKTFIKEFF